MNDVDKVKSKLDIVDIVGEKVQLKKAGRNFKAPCPFHNEKTASFVVSPERQIYHCFGCQKGGDMFTFVQEYENVGFAEALKELASKAGVKLEKPVFATEREKLQDLIYSLNHLSSQFYNYLLLNHPSGKRALKYLTDERHLSLPLINTFMLGYAPPTPALANFLIKKKKYHPEDLVVAGLAYQRGRDTVDFFRDRIIFPIIDHRGNVVAFSGRGLIPEQMPKYVNTKETPVYIKGDTLFGLNLARDGIKKEGKAIIVEGEFDVITAHKEGITNIVAVKGTALTENQIKLLKRFTPKFAFCFDTDPAGTEAQRRSIQLIEREGITATVIVPPLGKDPDELLNENPVLFKKAVKNDMNVYDFVIDSAVKQFDKNSAEGKKNILDKTLSYIAGIENEVIKEHYLRKLAESLDTSFDAISRQADKNIKPFTKPSGAEPLWGGAQLPHGEVLEIYLLSLIFQSENPKKTLVTVRTILKDVPLSTLSLEKVLIQLTKFEQKTPIFSPKDFTDVLPAELHVPFDTSYLAPIAEFIDEKSFNREVEKTVIQVRTFAVKKKLKELAELIHEAEIQKEEEKVTSYQEQFEKFSRLLSTSPDAEEE